MFTPDELTTLTHTTRILLEAFPREQARRLAKHLIQLTEDECFDRDQFGIHGLIRQAEVAHIARKEIRLDNDALLAVLLYRSVYKRHHSTEYIALNYGNQVARLVGLLIETSTLYMKTTATGQENFRHLLLATSRDLRVVLLLLADRLYLLRVAGKKVDQETRLRLVDEVSHLYAPLAHKLGLYRIKSEMEDLCLKYADRRAFDFVKRKLGETKQVREAYIADFITPLEARISSELPEITFSVKGRTKSIRSILNKLRKQNIPFENIYDLFAIRIIVDVPKEQERSICWRIYSVITDMYTPNPKRLKDWISIPKSNGYESLHITVMGADSRWVEVQIRSRRMDEVAERGVAAHWKYKGISSEQNLDDYMQNVRETLEAVCEDDPPTTKKSNIGQDINIYDDEIYVFTPKGTVIKLPIGATVLDFAFAIHSKVGCTATGAKVGNKNVPIRHRLSNGDVVEVITSANQHPKRDWLQIAVSPRAKNKIRSSLRIETEAGIEVSKELLHRRLKNRRMAYEEAPFMRLIRRKGYKTQTDFFLDLASERLDLTTFLDEYAAELRLEVAEQQGQGFEARSAAEFVLPTTSQINKEATPKGASDTDSLIMGSGLKGVQYSFAACCHPIFGDEIFGFASTQGIKIHRTDCPNATDLRTKHPQRVLPVYWSTDEKNGYRVRLSVVGHDDISVVSSVASIISKETGQGISRYAVDSRDGLFKAVFTVEVTSHGMLTNVIRKIRGATGIKSVARL